MIISIKKKFLANQDIFDTMCICFAAEKSIKQKKRINIYKLNKWPLLLNLISISDGNFKA